MGVKEIPSYASLNLFAASKPIRFLEKLKQLRFSGELVLSEPKGQKWSFYLYQGSPIYATGGIHPVRRWRRNLAACCPQISAHRSVLQQDLAIIPAAAFNTCWEYQLLRLWAAQQKITPEQVSKMIRAIAIEVLFDVAQAQSVTYQIDQDNVLSMPLASIDIREAIAQTQQLWHAWQRQQLTNYSPNSCPAIVQPEYLRERTSAKVYKTLSYLFNGKRTLRDVALLMKRDVLEIARSLLPFIQSGAIELRSSPDLPVPVSPPATRTPTTTVASHSPSIVCVDDSPTVCQTMEALLVAAGYQFVGVQDGLRAIATILARKPDLIFLDLVMPNTNGYEICAQLRKLAAFRDTPIVILTGSDGLVDRVRAKLVGASDFLSKPVDAGLVLNLIRKHLKISP